LAAKIRITLVEALPSVLPMFSKQLIDYTQSTFKQSKIEIMTKTMVKEIKDQSVVLQLPDKSIVDVPCGMVVWAAVDIFLSCKYMVANTLEGKYGTPVD
jgi:NADH:ubiquinone reductase (non-electrogenic)